MRKICVNANGDNKRGLKVRGEMMTGDRLYRPKHGCGGTRRST